MDSHIDRAISKFRNESSRILQHITENFEREAQMLDRERDENVFQQLQSRYTNELKNRLNASAQVLLEQFQGYIYSDTLRKELTTHISYTISAFTLKIKSM